MKVLVPCDMAGVSVGADAVVRAIGEQVTALRLGVTIVRNRSRGLFWLARIPAGRDDERTKGRFPRILTTGRILTT